MKHLKLFENLSEPDRGDYVVCDRDLLDRDKYKDLIGCIQIKTTSQRYFVDFVITKSWFERDGILFFSSRKKDVEAFIDKEIQKYNL